MGFGVRVLFLWSVVVEGAPILVCPSWQVSGRPPVVFVSNTPARVGPTPPRDNFPSPLR